MSSVRKFSIFIFILFFSTVAAQNSSCVNSDFELGDFTGWIGRTGYCCPISTTSPGIVSGRHTIMTGDGTDPNTCGNVTVVAPGGLYSARLGNDNVGSEAEKLTYSVTVDANNSIFIYKYAVVLQDPGHDPSEQPRFQLRVLDAAGTLIDPTCGEYTVVASSDLPGFQICNSSSDAVVYKDWTTVGLNLSPYIGQTLTIEFATGDCTPGAHFGYAYVDAYCSPPEISSTYCTGSLDALLTAPIGFSYLWNTGATTQSISVTNPVEGQTYTCQLTSVTGCTVNISTTLEPLDPLASFTLTNTCYDNAIFTHTSFEPPNTILDQFLWNFGDGTTSTVANPTHIFPAVGDYSVSFTISNGLGCSSTVSQVVTVYPAPTATISYPSAFYCSSLAGTENVTLTGTENYLGGVFSATPPGLTIDPSTGAIMPGTSLPGVYVIAYQIPPENNCTVPPSTFTITITQEPAAQISYTGSPFCTSLLTPQPVALTGIGAYTVGTFSASPAGLSINTSTGAILPNSSTGGIYTVFYTLPASGGCAGLTVSTSITIQQSPTAVIAYAESIFCTSETASQTVSLTGTGPFTGGTFSVIPPGLSLNTATGAIVPSTSTPGTYNIIYTIPAIGNCIGITVSTSVIINRTPIATAVASAAIICSNEMENITLASNVTGTTFTWTVASNNVSGTSPGTGNAINQVLATIENSQGSAVYTVTPTAFGCTGLPITITIFVNPLPLPQLTGAVICVNPITNEVERDYTLATGLDNNEFDFEWYYNSTAIPNEINSSYTATAAGMYSVIATNSVTGCVSLPVAAEISATYSAQSMSTSGYDAFTENQVVIVTVNGDSTYEYQLDDGEFQWSNTFYNVELGSHMIYVRDVDGCTFLSGAILVVDYPHFFTPNGDGHNDIWNIKELAIQPDATIYIFDRYGKLLKEISPNGPGWDGTYHGAQLPSTDYWFTVDYLEQNISKQFKSHFSLKR